MPSLFKTPDQYLAAMIDRLALRGSKITDFSIGSGARNLFEALGVAHSVQSAIAEQHRLDSYIATATGDALTAKALDQGVIRKAAVKATGTIRITRTDTTAAVTIAAGWSPLATVPTPGVTSVSYVTTADAVFGIGVATVDVAAQALDAGTIGNIAQGAAATVTVLPVNTVAGFDTATGFLARGPFAGGVDAETDDQLRTRIPLAVQARVKGKKPSFLAAALGVPGVTSAQVLQAGDSDGGPTIVAGNVKVYYEGSATLLTAVQAACGDAAVSNQQITVVQATDVPLTIAVTVFVAAGLDGPTVSAAVTAALKAVVVAVNVGDPTRFSQAVRAIHAIPEVQSMTIPFAQFRKTADAPGASSADVAATVGGAVSILDAAITVTVSFL